LRGRSEARDAAIHRVSKDAYGVWRFVSRFTVDRHAFQARDDNTE
jgi:hypothetical protein